MSATKPRDFTAKILANRSRAYDKLDYTPIAIPAGMVVPETQQQIMARMMLNSGMISYDDYQNMIGVTFDGDYTDSTETFNDFSDRGDDFRQSGFAQYLDDFSFAQEVGLVAKQEDTTQIPDKVSGSVERGSNNVQDTGSGSGKLDEPLSSQPTMPSESNGGAV